MMTSRKRSTRETTIFRFDRLVVATAVLALCAGTAGAQDTLRTNEQAQGARVHVVTEGETLWSLAARYLGDPFLWPEIYRLNTLVVEDPHWIFPGEELLLVPADATAMVPTEPPAGDAAAPVRPQQPVAEQEQAVAVPVPAEPVEQPLEMPVPVEAPPPPPPTEDVPTVFMAQPAPRGGPLGGLWAAVYRYRAVRAGEFYAAGFLTEGQELPWGRVLGAVGKPTLSNLTASSTTQLFGQLAVQPPAGAEYRVGDSLLVARLGRRVSDEWGEVVIPTGVAVVSAVAGGRVTAELVRQFEQVADGQVALPLEPFRDPGDVVPVPVEGGMEGVIIAPRDRHAVHGQQDVMFINLGRQDGVALGDVFEVVRPLAQDAGDTVWQQVAVMHVVHLRDRSASAVLIAISQLGTEAGAKVRLIRKIPS